MTHALTAPSHIRMDLRPTARELRWFAQIDRHGPQSSEFLYELTRDTHRCKDTALRRLQALRDAKYLRLPPQQRQIAKADFNPYIYDLTPLGWDVLSDHQALERHCRPTGHWWHGLWVAAITSAIAIAATRAGQEYIPAARILAIKNVDLAIPWGKGRMIPDHLFALKSADGYRAFALEMDRGTEPVRSPAARKSLARSVAQYRQVLAQNAHKSHYGLKSGLIVLNVFNSRGRQRQFAELLEPQDKSLLHTSVNAMLPRWEDVAQTVANSWAGGAKPLRLFA